MGQTLRPGVLANLEAEKLELLNDLSKQTRVPRAVLLREAVDDLLTKYGMQALVRNPPAGDVVKFRTRKSRPRPRT